jgi:hypothetical protein
MKMTQLELLKYAYIGALETCEDTKRLVGLDGEQNPDLINRYIRVTADFDEIRNALFAEIEKVTGPIE